MALDTSNLNTGGLLQARQVAKRARFQAFQKQLARKAALLGVGNPQGDFDVLMQEAAQNGDPVLEAAVRQYLFSQNPNDALPVLAALDDQIEFWLALAGKSAGEDNEDTDGQFGSPHKKDALPNKKKKLPPWLQNKKPAGDEEQDPNEAESDADADDSGVDDDDDEAQANGDAAAAGDDEPDEGDAREKMAELRNKKKKRAQANASRTADAGMSATAESVEDQMGAIKSLHYAIKGLTPSEKRITYGIVYPVNKVDLQGEWAERELVEKAAHNYLRLYRMADTEHSWQDVGGAVVESYIAPQRITSYFGKSLDEPIEEGAWIMAYQWPESEWMAVKSGRINGYSLGGLKRVKSGVMPPNS